MESDGYDITKEGNSIAEGLNSTHYTRARKLMMEGKWPRQCRLCEQYEKLKVLSVRQKILWQRDNEDFDINIAARDTTPDGYEPTPRITSMLLELGNLCNLECISCTPHSSNRWNGLHNRLNKKYSLGLGESKIYYQWYKRPEIIQELKQYMNTVRIILFSGGEPLLNKVHVELLRHCVEIGRADQIELRYSTNGTILPESLAELWGQFARVALHFSCDGHDEASVYYLRYPASLAKIMENVKTVNSWMFNELELGVYATINCINIFYLPEMDRMVTSNSLTLNAGPADSKNVLDPRVLPLHLKKIVKAKLEQAEFSTKSFTYVVKGLIDLMMSEDWSAQLPNLRLFLARLDGIRDITLRQAFPEMAAMISE
jgi:hypothetical protein